MLASKEGRELIGETYRILNEPVKQTLSQRTPDNVRAVVEQNLWQFSGFKTDLEMREAAKLMVNADGSVKPFKEFAADVKKINETYNLNYLKSEHDHVKRSAEMFEQWQKYTPDSVLQYRTMGDNRVREAHKKLQGVTLPASDPFWNSYYPPNGWRCRCSVSEVRKGKYPMSDSKKAIADGDESTKLPKQQMFRTNPGKTLNLMPEKHPYYPKGCGDCDKKTQLGFKPNNDKCNACRIINTIKLNNEDLKSKRKSSLEWAKQNLLDAKIQVKGFNNPVETNITCIKELINQPHRYQHLKLDNIQNIIELLEKGKYIKASPDEKNNPMIKTYHYVEIDLSDSVKSYAAIREMTNGKNLLYTITENMKESKKP